MTHPEGSGSRQNADVRQAMLASPALFLRDIDPLRGTAVFTPMSQDSYRASAFLDNRISRAGPGDMAVDLDDLVELAAGKQRQAPVIHYLFHVGHCGSTLISRLLGERPCYLSLREPPLLMGLSRSLRGVGQPGFPISRSRWESLRDLSLLMLGKTWRRDQTVLIKPTSHAGNLIPTLMLHTGGERGIFLYVDLETYLATMLRPHTRREVRLFAQDFRAREFADLVGSGRRATAEYSDAQLIAMTWLLQAREFASVMDDPRIGNRCLPLHFDEFLSDPLAGVARICDFLGPPLSGKEHELVSAGSWLSRSAKSPGDAYGPKDRARELATSREDYAPELQAGLDWAGEISETEAFSHLLDRFGPARARTGPL